MKPDKEKWTEEVMETVNHLKRAEVSSFLFSAIQHRIRNRNNSGVANYVNMPVIVSVAAGVILLIMLNIALLQNVSDRSTQSDSENYSLTGTDFNIY